MRVLPWLQDARRKPGQHDFLDCDACMEFNTNEIRQTMRCGFIPAERLTLGVAWTPEPFEELSVCAGYSTALPEVFDIAISYAHWETGQLTMACDGEQPPRALVTGCSSLKNAAAEMDMHIMRESNAKRGGG